MANVTGRLKLKGKNFEVLVDLDKALAFKKTGQGTMQNILAINTIFSDAKKGLHVSESDLKDAFGSTQAEEVAARIIKEGELQLPAEYKKQEREAKIKQVVDWLARNCLDPRTGTPHTADRISSVLHESSINIDNRSVQEQIPEIIKKLQVKLPIRIETKKLSVTVPASYTGAVYGLLHSLKEKEEWLNDGSLLCIINLPAGMQSEFYDKLNKITHGAALTEEIKEKE